MPIFRSLSLVTLLAGLWLFQQPTPGPKFVGGATYALPLDRSTLWKPGVTYNGGIPNRTTNCPASSGGPVAAGTSEATLQADLNGCASGQVLRLACGTFIVNDTQTPLLMSISGVTLRGTTNADGSPCTFLSKTNGAVAGQSIGNGDQSPVLVVGTSRGGKWCTMVFAPACSTPGTNGSVGLTADAIKGTFTVTVSSTTGLTAGRYVVLDNDEWTSGSYVALPIRQNTPGTNYFSWQSDRVAWKNTKPIECGGLDDLADPGTCDGVGVCGAGGNAACKTDGFGFFLEKRPVNEMKQIASIDTVAKTVTFTTPIHITYPLTKTPQLTVWQDNGGVLVDSVGVENVKMAGGGQGDLVFAGCSNCWAKAIELTTYTNDPGLALFGCFRCEVRDSYIHDAALSVPGGLGYAVCFENASAEGLVENNIIIGNNKDIVGRAAGTANVIAYNYTDDAFISGNVPFQEAGMNGSHLEGSHHWLFEGNESHNSDSDNTHGAVINMVSLRNHFVGVRRATTIDPATGAVCCSNPAPSAHTGNMHAAGVAAGSWWHSYVGNVLGRSGQMTGWTYYNTWLGPGGSPGDPMMPSIWQNGYQGSHWDQQLDPKVTSTMLREGNYDYVNNAQVWDTSPHNLPISWYVNGLNFTALTPPPFWPAACHYPWVDPTGATQLYTLPARWRYDQGTPFTATSPC